MRRRVLFVEQNRDGTRFGGAPRSCCFRPAAGAHGGRVEIVEDGVSGFLVPPGDPEALSGRLTTLLVSREIRERIGRAAVQRVNVFNVTQHV